LWTRFLVAGFQSRFVPPSPFPTTLAACSSPNLPACFSRSRSWGLDAFGQPRLEDGLRGDPKIAPSSARPPGLPAATRSRSTRDEPASDPSPANRRRGGERSTGVSPRRVRPSASCFHSGHDRRFLQRFGNRSSRRARVAPFRIVSPRSRRMVPDPHRGAGVLASGSPRFALTRPFRATEG
jgi:hypothetical protein